MTSRRVITLLLVVALVPVGLFGMANWRGAAPSDSTPSVRSQLGRAHARSFGIRLTESEEIESESAQRDSFRRASRTTANGRPLGPYTAQLGAEVVSDEDQMIAPEVDAVEPTRWWRGPAAAGGGRSSGGAAAASSAAAVTPSAAVEFVGVSQSGQVLNQEEFQAGATRELKIITWWNVTGNNTQRLELYTPTGALYRQFTAEFDADAVRTQSTGLAPVETRLPVSGSWITQYALLGAWRVDVYLVGQRTPITSASFVLN